MHFGIGMEEAYDVPEILFILSFLIDLHIIVIVCFMILILFVLLRFIITKLNLEEERLNLKYSNKSIFLIRNFLFNLKLIEYIIRYSAVIILLIISIIIISYFLIFIFMGNIAVNYSLITGFFAFNENSHYVINYINREFFTVIEIFMYINLVINLIMLFSVLSIRFRYCNIDYIELYVHKFSSLVKNIYLKKEKENFTNLNRRIDDYYFNVFIYYNIYRILFILFIGLILAICSFIFLKYGFDNLEMFMEQYIKVHIEIYENI